MAENARAAGSPAPGTLRPLSLPTHHPAQPQAGLAGGSDSDAGWSRVWRRLQCLDDPGRRAGGAGPHDVALPHAEPGGAARGQSRRAGAGVRGGRGRAGAPRRSLRGSCVSPSCHLVSMKTQMTHAALFPKRRPRAINVLRVGRAVSRVGAWAGSPGPGSLLLAVAGWPGWRVVSGLRVQAAVSPHGSAGMSPQMTAVNAPCPSHGRAATPRSPWAQESSGGPGAQGHGHHSGQQPSRPVCRARVGLGVRGARVPIPRSVSSRFTATAIGSELVLKKNTLGTNTRLGQACWTHRDLRRGLGSPVAVSDLG